MSISRLILKELDLYEKKKMYVIIDGKYWEHRYSVRSNGVYSTRYSSVSVKVKETKFYDEAKEKVSVVRSVGFYYSVSNHDEVELNGGIQSLCEKLDKPIFPWLNVDVSNAFSIHAQPDLNLVFINSGQYELGSKCAKLKEDELCTVNGVVLEPQVQLRIQEEFDKYQFAVYRDLVYGASGHRRFLNKFFRRDNIYNVQHAFIPTFIDIDFLHNPLLSEKYGIQNTALYKLAVEKNRVVEFGSFAKCYLLTHLEICQALGMHNFVRFTPDLWYKLVVGLLHNSLEGFPHTSGSTYYVISKERIVGSSLRSRYKAEEYTTLFEDLLSKLSCASSQREKTELEEKIDLLQQYTPNVNSLYLTCIDSVSSVSNYGASVLDGRGTVTASNLYNYLSAAYLV